jgi:hypothetical protein
VGANQRVHSIAPFAALPLQAPADGEEEDERGGDEEGERGDLEASHRPWSGGRAGGLEAVPEEEVAAWRERWFGGPVSRALYTIYEEEQETRRRRSTRRRVRATVATTEPPRTPFRSN